MKIRFKLLAIIATVSLPSVLMAQKTNSGFVPFSPGTRFFKENIAQKLKLSEASLENAAPTLFMRKFSFNLPGENRKLLNNNSRADPASYYNLPIVKPGKTSRILIAKLDPNSPYTYNMPIKNTGRIEK